MSNLKHSLTYNEEVTQYSKKDAVHALMYAGYVTLMVLLFFVVVNTVGVFRDSDGQLSFAAQILGVVSVPMYIGLLFVILKKKGQTLRSVGLHLIDWKKSLFVGLLYFVVFVIVLSLLPGLMFGWRLNDPLTLIWLTVYLLIMAVWEDVVFIGYIQTRIYGLVKKDLWAIALGGFVFAAFHYPNLVAGYILGVTMFDVGFWLYFLMMTASWILMHVLYNSVFRKYRSIISVLLFHFSWNVVMRNDLWAYTGDGMSIIHQTVIMIVTVWGTMFAVTLLPKLIKLKTAV